MLESKKTKQTAGVPWHELMAKKKVGNMGANTHGTSTV